MLKRLQNYSLRKRLIIAVVVCILLPWICTYIVSNYLTKDILEERAVKQSNDNLSMIEMSIKNVLNDIMYTSNYIQFDTNFNRLIKNHQSIDATSLEAEQEIALNYIEISSRLAGITDLLSPTYITIIFENDLYYMNYSINDYRPTDSHKESWMSDLKDLNIYQTKWIGAHPTYITSDQQHSPYLISIARNIENNNYQDAYIIISIKEKDIRAYLENFQNSNSEYYLTDQQGNIFSSIEGERIGENLGFNVSSTGHQIVNFNNEAHLLNSYPVSYSDWRLVSLVPYKETIGNINVMTRTTLVIQGTFLFLFLIGLIILVREMTKPVVELHAVTKSVENGDLSRRAEISGNNDIANLGSAFNNMLDTIEEMVNEIKIQERGKRTAELEMLQAQINPHFLFNVLNAIRLHIKMNGDNDSAQLINDLSSLLRMTINRNNAFISLEEELKVVEHYTSLMSFRHEYEVDLVICVDTKSTKIEVPRFFLQPLIENAIIHGYSGRDGSIVVTGSVEDKKYLKLQILDDGVGMTEEKLAQLKRQIYGEKKIVNGENFHSFNGIGIQNVYQRIKMIYGDRASMDVESVEGEGTSFTFNLPLKE
ncbi:sensor histidine kinase [Salipaludibacillus sp. HK11]|uniref:sensor histidine kinase n=1 Tax=Salipaludibacillus sp. HK11 TaxID=3394320 RepID=UPI0039FDDBC2